AMVELAGLSIGERRSRVPNRSPLLSTIPPPACMIDAHATDPQRRLTHRSTRRQARSGAEVLAQRHALFFAGLRHDGARPGLAAGAQLAEADFDRQLSDP